MPIYANSLNKAEFHWIGCSIAMANVAFILCFAVIAAASTSASALASAGDLYNKHCAEFVGSAETLQTRPENSTFVAALASLRLDHATFRGGEPLFNASESERSRSIWFSPSDLRRTTDDQVFAILGRLRIRGGGFSDRRFFVWPRNRLPHLRGPKANRRNGVVSVSGEGFWSNFSNRLCIIATGNRILPDNGAYRAFRVSVKFQYPRIGSILNSFVNGTVEEIENANGSALDFGRISVFGIFGGAYEYTKHRDAEKFCGDGNSDVIGAVKDVADVCSSVPMYRPMALNWDLNCSGPDCSPFNMSKDLLPGNMGFLNLVCDSGKVRGLVGFGEFSVLYGRTGLPSMALIGEGVWDSVQNRLCMVSCRFEQDFGVNDCSVQLSLQIPAFWTVQRRHALVGHVTSSRSSNDSLYFKKFEFSESADQSLDFAAPVLASYRYTMMDKVQQVCKDEFSRAKSRWSEKAKFPDGSSFDDLGFNLLVERPTGQPMSGRADVFSIGYLIHRHLYMHDFVNARSVKDGGKPSSSLLNISYGVNFGVDSLVHLGNPESKPGEWWSISAEGLYDTQTGLLCIVGCKAMDCEINIVVQFAPFASSFHATGIMKSLRGENDSLYFKPMKLSSRSIYSARAKKIIVREDLELILALISGSLAALMICSQLFYANKHSDCLPTTSLLMLTLLAAGYMIPLVLNFEAFFSSQKRKNVLEVGGGWFELNEVLIRLITMVAFLLQVRLLQLAWNAKVTAENQKSAWFWERQILYICLPLYIIGALIACLVHWLYLSHFVNTYSLQAKAQHNVWEVFRSYCGVILDGFLLPQILGNIFWDISRTVLVPYFYGGITLIRAMPHLYDAYRTIKLKPQLDTFYYYANPEWDFYSLAWDIAIPCAGLLFAVVIFMQQKYGGRCIVPMRFRHHVAYQKISLSEVAEQDDEPNQK